MRIENRNYIHTLVGEASSFNIQSNSKAVYFKNYRMYKKLNKWEIVLNFAKGLGFLVFNSDRIC